MRKKILPALILFVVVCFSMQAQTIDNQVISSTGITESTTKGSISWTVGEAIVGTVEVQDRMLTQGFHQPYLIDCGFEYETEINCIGNDEYLLTVKGNDTREYNLSQSGNFVSKGTLNVGFTLGPFQSEKSVQAKLELVNQSYCSKTINIDAIDCQSESFQILAAQGEVKAEGNLISWTTFGSLKTGSVVLQKSDGNEKFEELFSYSPNSSNFNQSFIDQSADQGLNTYRVVEFDQNMEIVDVKEVALMRVSEVSKTQYNIETYPNPVVDELTVYFKDYDFDHVIVSFFSTAGNSIMANKLEIVDNKVRLNVRNLDNTMYLLSIATPDGKLISTQKIQKVD